MPSANQWKRNISFLQNDPSVSVSNVFMLLYLTIRWLDRNQSDLGQSSQRCPYFNFDSYPAIVNRNREEYYRASSHCKPGHCHEQVPEYLLIINPN